MEWLTKILNTLKQETLKEVYTSIPAKVLNFNPEKQTVEVKILIQSKTFDNKDVDLPEIVNVPVFQFGDQNFFIETQIEIGTEGSLFFAHRDFNKWTETGDVAPQEVVRVQDINDCYFIAGVRSKPNLIQDHLNDGIRIRDKADETFLHLKKDKSIQMKTDAKGAGNFFDFKNDGTLHIKAKNIIYEVDEKITLKGDLEHQGDTEHTGDLNQTGDVNQTGDSQVSGDLTANNVTGSDNVTVGTKGLKDHTHSAGTYTGNQGAPIQGTSGTNN